MHRPRDPYISVLLPVYNGASFLRAAIESVLAQTLGDLECGVVDDGSSDGSAEVAAGYARRDARVRLIRLERHRGLVPALNAAVVAARGRLLSRAWTPPTSPCPSVSRARPRRSNVRRAWRSWARGWRTERTAPRTGGLRP
jgi:hypothetical protein